jgi:signal transduction histidine kinase
MAVDIGWQHPEVFGRARWLTRGVRSVPHAALAVSAVLDMLWAPHAQLPGTMALVGVAALWLVVPLVPQWTDKGALQAVYFVGLLGLALALVLRSPVFGYFAFSGYLHTMQCLRGRWRLAGVLATAALLSFSQIGGTAALTAAAWPSLIVVTLFNAAVAGAVTILSWIAADQTEAHKRTIGKLESTMAENAGLHAQLLASAREAGVHDERERLAQEIHDTLAQGLIGIITQLQAAETGNDAERRRHLDTAARLARENLSEARRSVRALRPEALVEATLPEALSAVVARWSADAGVPAQLTTTGTARPIHPELEASLLRTAQEALANVAKHAEAGRVGLTLSYMDDVVSLDIRDDGRGFMPEEPPRPHLGEGGFGLTAMRQRLRRVAGTLAIESEPGAGTAVSASVPAIPAEVTA